MAAKTYIIFNSANAAAAAPVAQPTGNAIRTMMQIKLAAGFSARVIEWGCSFDGSAAATPGKVELIDTGTVAATVTTAYVSNDIQIFGDQDAPTQTTWGMLTLSTTTSGFASAAGTEGSVAAPTRVLDCQLVAPTNQYVKQFPLGREPNLTNANYLRIRATFGTTVNMICYVILEF